jgi:hypothetical protein
LVASGAAVVEVEASVGQAADDKGLARLIVVDAFSDEVEFLTLAAVARLDGDGNQVLTEVTSGGVNGETLAVGALDLDTSGSTGGSKVLGLGLSNSGGVERTCGAEAVQTKKFISTRKETTNLRHRRP